MTKRILAQLAFSGFIAFKRVSAGTIHYVEDVHGLQNYLTCDEGFKPECGDRIEKSDHPCHSDPTSEQFCEMPSTTAGNAGKQMECIPKNCIVHSQNSSCDRSGKKSKVCKKYAGAAGVMKRPRVNFIVGNVEKANSYASCSTKQNECFEVEGFRISCKSDEYEPGANYGGAIVYKTGNHTLRIRPGYVILKKIDGDSIKDYKNNLKSDESPEGMVHGQTVYHRFGMNPSTLDKKYGMLISGFGYREEGRPDQLGVGFKSSSLNLMQGWKHRDRSMVEDERVVVTALVNVWKQHGIAKSYWAKNETALKIEREKSLQECNGRNSWRCRKLLRKAPKKSLIPYICDVLTGKAGLDISDSLAQIYRTNWYPECATK